MRLHPRSALHQFIAMGIAAALVVAITAIATRR